MSKRDRQGDVLTACHKRSRLCGERRHGQWQSPPLKRKHEEEPLSVNKRYRHMPVAVATPSLKRPRDGPRDGPREFDQEVEHLHKRMRATVPTPEQTMAFMLPHVMRFRHLYTTEVQKVELLQQHNTVLSSAYTKLLATQTAQRDALLRELHIAKYHLSLCSKPYN